MIGRSALLILICSFALSTVCAGEASYRLGPDSMRHDGVPRGAITEHVWRGKVFPDTARKYWVYVPAQYDSDEPACLMVFQDGQLYVDGQGEYRTAIVFDNLIHEGSMPVTIGVFVNPGHSSPGHSGDRPAENALGSSNRSFEYNALTDQYAQFLLKELLPEIGAKYRLTDDPEGRAICGFSSGGICAFTVAWQRPDQFRKILTHCGSFTDIRGGHNYPPLVRKTPNKPIRVFLQSGTNDLNIHYGDWWLANLQMESALKFKKYDYKFVGGTGGHNGKHGGAILPDSLRWLWREDDLE